MPPFTFPPPRRRRGASVHRRPTHRTPARWTAALLAVIVACEGEPFVPEQQPVTPVSRGPVLQSGTWTGANNVAEVDFRVKYFDVSNNCVGVWASQYPPPPHEVTGTYRDQVTGKSVAVCSFTMRGLPDGRVLFYLDLKGLGVSTSKDLQYVRTGFLGRIVDADIIEGMLFPEYNRDWGGGSWSAWTGDSSAITLRRTPCC